MSTIRVDKIMPFQSSSVEIVGSFNGTYSGSFSGSFVGDGSGLTGIPGATPIETGSFATTGSNSFIGNQIVTGSVTISGSISQVGIGTNNTIIGRGAGSPTGTGINTLVGVEAGRDLTTGYRNTFFGAGAGQLTSGGDSNTYIGQSAGVGNTSGSSNIAVGRFAGARLLDGTTPATNLGTSIFIGNFTESDGDNIFNQIVIGDSAEGGGQNTVTLGNNGITNTYLKGVVSGSSFTGSFVGDGSGLTNIPGVNPIETGSFATTGSNTFVGNQIVSASVDVSGSVTADVFQIGTPPTYSENTAYWIQTSFTIPGGISFGFSEGNSIANIDNVYINETSSNTNGESIVNSLSWINGLVIGDIITIQGVSGSPSNLNQTIVLSVNSITDFEDGTWGIGVSVVSSTPEAAPVNGSLYSLTYTTTTISEYAITADESRLLVSSSNTEFNGFVVLSQVSSSYNFADDSAAASGGVPLGGLYHTSGSVKIRLV
jgi:hypothetical protein